MKIEYKFVTGEDVYTHYMMNLRELCSNLIKI